MSPFLENLRAIPPEAVRICVAAAAVGVAAADPDIALIALVLAGAALALQALTLWRRGRT